MSSGLDNIAGEPLRLASTPASATLVDDASSRAAATKAAEPAQRAEKESAQQIRSAAEARNRAFLEKLQDGAVNPNARLLIDRDEASGAFVYKSVDSRTGETLNQWPREEVVRRMGDAAEAPGIVVDRKI